MNAHDKLDEDMKAAVAARDVDAVMDVMRRSEELLERDLRVNRFMAGVGGLWVVIGLGALVVTLVEVLT